MGLLLPTSLLAPAQVSKSGAAKASDLGNECPDGELCMHRWWKAVIQVEKTLEGQPISGRITAAVSQHVPMNEKYKKAVRYFTLESIEDPAIREHLHADYYLQEGSIDPPERSKVVVNASLPDAYE